MSDSYALSKNQKSKLCRYLPMLMIIYRQYQLSSLLGVNKLISRYCMPFFYKFLQEKKIYFVPGKTRVNHDKEPFLTEVQTCMWLNEKTNFKH